MPILILLTMFFSNTAPLWQVQTSGVEATLRGVSVIQTNAGKYVVWASGTKGTVLRSTDEGKSWQQLKVDGGSDLDFRDIEAFGEETAYTMSSGDGEKSRIYKTTDGGKSWMMQYTDKRPGFFLDALVCDSKIHCYALSDPVDGKFVILATHDGQHWQELPRDKMPTALPAEGAFAASGTSIALCNNNKNVYFGTGGPAARIFRSADHGRSWTATETPVARGNASSGIFSIACHDRFIVAVGGDYQAPANANKAAAYSNDSGETWHLADQQPGGYRSEVAFLSDGSFVAVGTNGTDISHDNGIHWIHMDALNLNAASFAGTEAWAVGPKGSVARLNIARLR
jgi:photosystem II stability/assembly factor-like uncharacterized protein